MRQNTQEWGMHQNMSIYLTPVVIPCTIQNNNYLGHINVSKYEVLSVSLKFKVPSPYEFSGMKTQTKGDIREETVCLTFILVLYQFSTDVLPSGPNFLYNFKDNASVNICSKLDV